MKQRTRIPVNIQSLVLAANRHTCCICREHDKPVHLHHIDGNPLNNEPSNLAVVCMNCHSRVTGKQGLGKGFLADEVKAYKTSWEEYVGAIGGGLGSPKKILRGVESRLVEFDIRKQVYGVEIEEDPKRLQAILGLLFLYAVEERFATYIVMRLHDQVFGITAKKDSVKARMVVQYLPMFFAGLHFPDRFPPEHDTEKGLLYAIDTIHPFALCERGGWWSGDTVQRACIEALHEICDLAQHSHFKKAEEDALKAIVRIGEMTQSTEVRELSANCLKYHKR